MSEGSIRFLKSPVDDLYLTFGAFKLADLQKYKLLIIMHKFMHTSNVFLAALKDLFIQHSEIHRYNTRIKYDLHATHVSTKINGHKKLSNITRQMQYWNSLCSQLKREQSLRKFKNILKDSIAVGYQYYVDKLYFPDISYTSWPKYVPFTTSCHGSMGERDLFFIIAVPDTSLFYTILSDLAIFVFLKINIFL